LAKEIFGHFKAFFVLSMNTHPTHPVWSAIEIVFCGSVGAVCELEWVQGIWDDGVVSHDQPFKAFHGYRCECYRAIII
jgi:hypothetical protein